MLMDLRLGHPICSQMIPPNVQFNDVFLTMILCKHPDVTHHIWQVYVQQMYSCSAYTFSMYSLNENSGAAIFKAWPNQA